MTTFIYIGILFIIIVVAVGISQTEHFEMGCKLSCEGQGPISNVTMPQKFVNMPGYSSSQQVPEKWCLPGFSASEKDDGCTITCPDSYLANTREASCPALLSGYMLHHQVTCPVGYKEDNTKDHGKVCIKKKELCPPGFEMKDGFCYKKCPAGLDSANIMWEGKPINACRQCQFVNKGGFGVQECPGAVMTMAMK